ncbi:MAG: hypothetical protein IH589_17360 [Anaerolineales bacterium]|nr:hypothetical protein [Anaerolineales bacterium]
MGRKGVSKRKPKKDKKLSVGNFGSPVNGPVKANSPVQSLVKNNEAVPNNGRANPADSNKKNRRDK